MGECFPKSAAKLPQLLNYNQSGESGYEEIFRAIDGTDNFLIFGGSSTSKEMNTGREPNAAIIVRMDLDLHTRRWAKALALNSSTNSPKAVEAIAIKAFFEDQVAVFARGSRDNVFERGE